MSTAVRTPDEADEAAAIKAMATTAYHAAMLGNGSGASAAVQAIGDTHGWRGVEYALRLWADTLLGLQGIRPGSYEARTAAPAFVDVEDGRITTDPNDVDAARQWAGRMIMARARDDEAEWTRNLHALPLADTAATGDHVLAVLQAAANTATGHAPPLPGR